MEKEDPNVFALNDQEKHLRKELQELIFGHDPTFDMLVKETAPAVRKTHAEKVMKHFMSLDRIVMKAIPQFKSFSKTDEEGRSRFFKKLVKMNYFYEGQAIKLKQVKINELDVVHSHLRKTLEKEMRFRRK